MELKYMSQTYGFDPRYCSNRTFMELKSNKRTSTGNNTSVLIVPLWN